MLPAHQNLLEDWLETCRNRPRLSCLVALLAAAAVAAVDLAMGDEIPLLVCYLPSVMVVTWAFSTSAGSVLAAACCTAWLVDDVIGLSEESLTPAELWTTGAHAVFYATVIAMLAKLRVAYEKERRLARTDGLTGLLNAKAFHERSEEELARSVRHETTLSIAFIDCDNFKTVNDTLGHLEGDRLLATIAQEMRAAVRRMDVPARMGGDEFAVLLPETSAEDAELVIQRMQERLTAEMRRHNWPVTFSIGVAVYETPPRSVAEMIHGADELMYSVKKSQKDAFVLRLVA